MRCSQMFVIGSIFLTASSSDSYFPGNLNFPQDWICSWHTKSCYWVTDDVDRLKGGSVLTSSECRYDQPELTLITSMFVNTHVPSLCGCQYCSFTIPTAAPTRGPSPSPTPEPTPAPTPEPTNITDTLLPETPTPAMPAAEAEYDQPLATALPTLAPTHDVNWMTFDQEELFRNKDTTSPLEWINFFNNQMGFSLSRKDFLEGDDDYSVFFCIKSLEEPYSTTCEPVIICTPSPSCGKKETSTEEVSDTPKKASGDLKALWGLLFLPGFCVGICAAYGVYRQRVKNRKKESEKGVIIEPLVPQNQPVQQGVTHAVADPRQTNGKDSRHMDESIAIMN